MRNGCGDAVSRETHWLETKLGLDNLLSSSCRQCRRISPYCLHQDNLVLRLRYRVRRCVLLPRCVRPIRRSTTFAYLSATKEYLDECLRARFFWCPVAFIRDSGSLCSSVPSLYRCITSRIVLVIQVSPGIGNPCSNWTPS